MYTYITRVCVYIYMLLEKRIFFISELVICACAKQMKRITPFTCFAVLLLIFLGVKPQRIGPFTFNFVCFPAIAMWSI